MTKILANLDQEWNGKISRARSRLMVFSPYIMPCATVSSLAERGAKVYTRFSLRDFASKASSLDALEDVHVLLPTPTLEPSIRLGARGMPLHAVLYRCRHTHR